MNVLTILRSVEDLLYEVMSWLFFYPRKLWMTLTRPLSTMRHSDQEQRGKPEKQYLETLSPLRRDNGLAPRHPAPAADAARRDQRLASEPLGRRHVRGLDRGRPGPQLAAGPMAATPCARTGAVRSIQQAAGTS